MTGRPGNPRVAYLRAPSVRAWFAVGDRSGFWLLASAVFAVNGLFSALQHHWWLAVLQMTTALLAVRAAVLTRVARRAPSPAGDQTGA